MLDIRNKDFDKSCFNSILSNREKCFLNIDRNTLLGFINNLTKNKQELKKVASKSCFHPNGFYKLVLVDNESEKYRVRLHIWEKGSDSEEDIHDHTWNFNSMILAGKLKVKKYIFSDSGDEFHHYTHLGNGLGFNPSIDYLGAVKLDCISEDELIAGCSYSLSGKVLHSVKICPSSGYAATLVFQGSFVSNKSNIFSKSHLDLEDEQLEMKWLSSDELLVILNKFLEKFESSNQ